MANAMKLIGEADLNRKLEKKLATPAAARFLFDSWRQYVQPAWMSKFTRGPGGWIWKGASRQSATSERDMSDFPRWARVGSNLPTARWGELGTGLLSIDPESSHRRYFPPPSAMEAWAKDRGFESGWAAANAIYKAGGTAPRGWLKASFNEAVPKIDGWLSGAAQLIEKTAPTL